MMFLLVCCCALGGCHSLRFGGMFAGARPRTTSLARATLDAPVIATGGENQDGLPYPRRLADGPNRVRLIDLTTALQRAGSANPTVACAEENVRVRLAEEVQARALLFPTLNAGLNVRVHRGNFLSGGGTILDTNIQSMYFGAGAGALGAGTVAVPGIRLVSHLADAVYAPQAAREQVVQSRSDANSTRQTVLLEVGVGYLALVEAQARWAAYGESLRDFAEIERLTTNFAKAGQGRDSDAQRAGSEALLLQADARRADEAIGVAAADLARLLDLDPADALRAADVTPPLLEMVDSKVPLEALLDQALARHPEIAARAAEVSVREIRVRQERARPWFPLIAVGFSAGEYGGSGPNTKSQFGDFLGRTDLDVAAVWSLQGLGLGNRAVRNAARANLEMAQLDLARTLDRVRQEVVEARALTEARRQDMDLARKRVESSLGAYQQDLTRAKNNLGRPLEVLASANQLAAARQDLVQAMIAYSRAQLQLYTALGAPFSMADVR